MEEKREFVWKVENKEIDNAKALVKMARNMVYQYETKKGTIAICPGCHKEIKGIKGEKEEDGNNRLLKHLGDRSANEYATKKGEPMVPRHKKYHCSIKFWKQIMAIEKVKKSSRRGSEGSQRRWR